MKTLDSYLPAGTSAESLLAFLIGMITFLCVLSLWRTLTEERPRIGRVRAVLRRQQLAQIDMPVAKKRRRAHGRESMAQMAVRRLRLMRMGQTQRIAEKLARAGLRSPEALAGYVSAKFACPVAFALAGFVMASLVAKHFALGIEALTACLGAGLGFIAPDIHIANQAAKRRQSLHKALPDGLDLLVICAEAGLTLDASLHRVSEEVATSSPELADELSVTSIELNFLPDRKLALANLAKRVDLPAVRGVVNTLVQTERYGTPLAQSLRVLSAEFREQRMLRAEEKAARLPATLTVPMIVFILPTLFVVLIGPAILDVTGHLTK